MRKKYCRIEKYNTYIQFIFTINKRNKYYLIDIKNNNKLKKVITNANDVEEAYENVSEEFPLYQPTSYNEIPIEYDKYYDTTQTEILNIYNRTKNGLKLYKKIEHNVLIGQTSEMIQHMYSREYKDYYVQTICKRKKDMTNTKSENKSLIINLTKKLRAATNISILLCKESVSKAFTENEDKTENEIYTIAYNNLLLKNKDKVIKTNSSEFKNFITLNSHIPSTAVMLKFGFITEQAKNIVGSKYMEELKEIMSIYLSRSVSRKVINKKILEKPLYTIQDLLVERFSAGKHKDKTVSMVIKEIETTLSEHFQLINAEKILTEKGIGQSVHSYIHHNGSLGATIVYDIDYSKFRENTDKDDTDEFIKHLTHQLVLNRPLCLRRNQLVKSIVDYEQELIELDFENKITKEIDEKKKGALLKNKENIIKGGLNKFINTVVFEEQNYILDDEFKPSKEKSSIVGDMLKERHITIIDYVLI